MGAYGDYGSDDGYEGAEAYDKNEEESSSHQKLAMRGRDIINKLSHYQPVGVRRSNENGGNNGEGDDSIVIFSVCVYMPTDLISFPLLLTPPLYAIYIHKQQ